MKNFIVIFALAIMLPIFVTISFDGGKAWRKKYLSGAEKEIAFLRAELEKATAGK